MKKLLGILVLGLLWCNVGFASEAGGTREPGTDEKCFYVFEKENVFERKFLPKVKKNKGVFVTYIGCNKYYDDWSWDYSLNSDIDAAHLKAYSSCVENEMPKTNLTGCHLFSIDDVIVWGKDAAFVAKVEKEVEARLEVLKTKLAKKKPEDAEKLTKSCIKKGTTEFNEIVKATAKTRSAKRSAHVMYFGCINMDNWHWRWAISDDLDEAKEKAYRQCVTKGAQWVDNCHLFSIGDKIVYGDVALRTKIEEKLKKKLAKKKKSGSHNYVQQYLLSGYEIFSKMSPTTFKKLTFNNEKNIGKITKRIKRNSDWSKKKTFRSFSFTAEFEDNITVEIFVEYEKDKKDFKKSEKEALFFSHMYGQMPHFLKEHNKKIYVHNDNSYDDGLGLWWVNHNKREFHINAPRKGLKPSGRQTCREISKYSNCAEVMVHELAHVIQQLTGVIPPSKWAKARKLDKKKYASQYAKVNTKEDFAESVVAWVAVRYMSDKISESDLKKYNEFIPNRLKLFDEMNFNMHPL